MKALSDKSARARTPQLLLALCLLTLSACSLLKPSTAEPPTFYALNPAPKSVGIRAPESAVQSLPTLIIAPTRAASGFDSQRIIYVRNAHQLEYFAHSEWVDTPARMLSPLLAAAIESTGALGAVVVTPAGASGDLRLETEIIRLQHNFQTNPGQVQFTLRAFLLDDKTRRVLAWREFHSEANSASHSPQGGVVAANEAVQNTMDELARFVAAHAR
jgi:cholesterol transport system auxiliary component